MKKNKKFPLIQTNIKLFNILLQNSIQLQDNLNTNYMIKILQKNFIE